MDGMDFDEMCEMSETEIDALLDREMRAYAQWYDRLSLPQQIAHQRRCGLDNCRSSRRLMQFPNCPEIIRENARQRLRSAQVRLLKVRTWRAAGTYPGEA